MPVSLPSQELDHGDIVREGGCSAYDLIEVRLESEHLSQGFVEFLGRSKIVRRKNQCCPRPQFLELLGLAFRGRLEFYVNKLAACGGRFVENVQLGNNRPPKLSSARRSSTSGNHDRADVGFEK